MSKTLKNKIVLLTSPHNFTVKSSKDKEKLKEKSISINKIKTTSMSDKRLNENFIKILSELGDLMMKKGEPFRAKAYQKAEAAIIKYPDDIVDIKQITGKPDINLCPFYPSVPFEEEVMINGKPNRMAMIVNMCNSNERNNFILDIVCMMHMLLLSVEHGKRHSM